MEGDQRGVQRRIVEQAREDRLLQRVGRLTLQPDEVAGRRVPRPDQDERLPRGDRLADGPGPLLSRPEPGLIAPDVDAALAQGGVELQDRVAVLVRVAEEDAWSGHDR